MNKVYCYNCKDTTYNYYISDEHNVHCGECFETLGYTPNKKLGKTSASTTLDTPALKTQG